MRQTESANKIAIETNERAVRFYSCKIVYAYRRDKNARRKAYKRVGNENDNSKGFKALVYELSR